MDASVFGILDKKLPLFLLNLQKLKKSNPIVGLLLLEMLIIQLKDALWLAMTTEILNCLISRQTAFVGIQI